MKWRWKNDPDVDQQDEAIVEGKRNLGPANDRLRASRVPHEVVAIERDVEGAGRHPHAREAG